MNKFLELLNDNPIIAAVKDIDTLRAAIESNSDIIFLLKADLETLKQYIDIVRKADKILFVHFDLIEGLSRDQAGLSFLINNYNPHGIISTKSNIIKNAKEKGIYTIQRFFLLDSLNLDTTINSVKSTRPDAIEILPGAMPKVTKIIVDQTRIPVITGGLIMDKEDVIGSLKAGASGISTSKKSIWEM